MGVNVDTPQISYTATLFGSRILYTAAPLLQASARRLVCLPKKGMAVYEIRLQKKGGCIRNPQGLLVYPEGGVECVLLAVHIESEKRIYGSIVGSARM